MKIGIPKETLQYENRVAISSDVVKKLISSNYDVYIESNAGEKAFISNNDYINAGAKIANSPTEIYSCDIIFKVNLFFL